MTRICLLAALLLASCQACSEPAPSVPDVPDATPPAVAAPSWTLTPNSDGTIQVAYDHTPFLTTTYGFFRKGWAWGGHRVVDGVAHDDGHVTFTIDAHPLGLNIQGSMRALSERTLEVEYTLTASKTVDGLEGGGLEFAFKPTPRLRADGLKVPELDGQRGFSVPVGDSALQVRFDEPLARLYFEQGRKNRIRAFFVGDTIQPGTRTVRMELTVPPGGTIAPSLAQRYGQLDTETWAADALTSDATPIDLSFLNASDPVGSHGRVRARGDALEFEDGTPARFWGVNLAAATVTMTAPEQMPAQAHRLAAFGVNLVRLHHHDPGWLRDNIFGRDATNTRALDPGALDHIDRWVQSLRREGIYVWIDLHVERVLRDSDDIDAFAELASQKGQLKGFNYVNASIEARMQEFAQQYLEHENPYTALRYADDPGVVMVAVTNENDLTFHGVKPFMSKVGVDRHRDLLRRAATPYLERSGTPVGALGKLPRPGPAKPLLAELEASFAQRAIDHLRTLGYRGPVATTQYWGKSPLYMLPSLTVGDVVDAHAYGDGEFLERNPLSEPNFVAFLASAQVAGMPFTVSEWNVPEPARDRFSAPLYVASVAALQQWDALAMYTYAMHPLPPPRSRLKWGSLRDPALMAMMPAAAMLYRQGHVRPAQKTYRLQLSREQLYEADLSVLTSAALRTLADQSRIEIGLPDLPHLAWDTPAPGRSDAIVVQDPAQAFLTPESTAVHSDTEELTRDWVRGVHTIDTARTQAAQGWLGGTRVELEDLVVELTTPKASVALTSLDGEPIRTSKRMLLTVIGQAARPNTAEQVPLYLQPIDGVVTLRSKLAKLTLRPLSSDGGPPRPPVERVARDGAYRIELESTTTPWFELTLD